ncbi:MAG: putative outer-membrane protein precursor [Nitrobacter sp.]|uniref:outer membrane protein n=1 Tax=Nitrobacter sp. TaxID=29420 RepID=UPI00387DE66E
MNKLLIGAVGALVIGFGAAPASAADLAPRHYTKAPPMIAAIYDWSGFYIGANGGWGSAHDHRFNAAGVNLGSYDADGGVAGGQIGYRWQTGSWVLGLEAQGDWADLSARTQNLNNTANQIASKLDAFGLFTGQVGYAWNSALLYAKGGAAVVDQGFDFISNATGAKTASSGTDTHWGATIGAGVEVGIAPNWSVAFEYDHIFLDRHDANFTTAAGTPSAGNPYRTGGDVDLVTARINYRWGGPAIARY